MSQHDLDLANAAGASFRSDLNSALVALGTLQSGASAPATTFAYMLWADTTNGLLKQRNAANSGWIVRGALAESFVLSRSSNTILAGADLGKAIIATAGFTQTLTAAATLGDGWFCDYNAQGYSIVLDPNGAETIDGATTKTVTGSGRIYCNGSAFFTIGFPASSVTAVCAAVRQTVSSGPTDSNGLPNLSGSTGSTTVTTSNISSTAPLAVAAAYGFDNTNGKALDYFGFSTSNLSWTGLSTNGTMFLYVDVNTTTGALTTGSTTLAPTYQWGGTYSATNNQHTYNIQDGQMRVGNGSTASQVARVFVGQVTVSGGVVTAITWYAYSGRYQSPFTSTLPSGSTNTTLNHNLGVYPGTAEVELECTSAEYGFAVGDRLKTHHTNNGASVPVAFSYTATAMTFTTGNTNAWVTTNRSTYSNQALTLANWKYRATAYRGW